jgi:pimeloyl-ACP methyl ester carboxylesterase
MSENSDKPAIVLVHGAWADSTSWNTVIPELVAAGFQVYAPPNPLRGVASDAASIAAFVKTLPGPVILVGHSYGGTVITVAAPGNANVKALVYIDAFVPDEGETVTGLLSGGPPPPADFLIPVPLGTTGDADMYLNPKYYGAVFASDIPAPAASLMAITQRPLTGSSFDEKTPGPVGWKTLPSWYVLGDADLVIPPPLQLMMAERAKSTITHVNGSHPSMVQHPEATVAAIMAATHGIEAPAAR